MVEHVDRHDPDLATPIPLRALGQGRVSQLGETSEDGNFTVIEAECLAACGFPTCVQINERYYENVTAADVPKIIEHLRSQRVEGAR